MDLEGNPDRPCRRERKPLTTAHRQTLRTCGRTSIEPMAAVAPDSRHDEGGSVPAVDAPSGKRLSFPGFLSCRGGAGIRTFSPNPPNWLNRRGQMATVMYWHRWLRVPASPNFRTKEHIKPAGRRQRACCVVAAADTGRPQHRRQVPDQLDPVTLAGRRREMHLDALHQGPHGLEGFNRRCFRPVSKLGAQVANSLPIHHRGSEVAPVPWTVSG